jgi:predicted MFS family arabinose efflux permease
MGERKNLGMGVLSGVGSIGAATFSVAAGWTIAELDWRTAATTAAIVVAALLPIVIWWVPRETPCVATPTSHKPSTRSQRPIGMMLTPYYAFAVLMSALAAFGMSSIFFHVVPIMMNAGLSQQRASEVLGATWLLSGIGSLCTGAIANRVGASATLAGAMLVSAAGTLFLLLIGVDPFSTAATGLFILLWGATANTVNQFLPILFVERFGAAHLGFLLGVQSAFMGIVGSAAPIATGALFDLHDNYSAAVIMSISVTFTAFLVAIGLAFGRRGHGEATA